MIGVLLAVLRGDCDKRMADEILMFEFDALPEVCLNIEEREITDVLVDGVDASGN